MIIIIIDVKVVVVLLIYSFNSLTMKKSFPTRHIPRANVFGVLTRKYSPFEKIDPTKNYDESDIAQFNVSFLFSKITYFYKQCYISF